MTAEPIRWHRAEAEYPPQGYLLRVRLKDRFTDAAFRASTMATQEVTNAHSIFMGDDQCSTTALLIGNRLFLMDDISEWAFMLPETEAQLFPNWQK